MTSIITPAAERFRTIGFYQPFGTLMLLGKTETRWVRAGKKPPFPLGKYLFYTCKASLSAIEYEKWIGGRDGAEKILSSHYLKEQTSSMQGWAIGIGELYEVVPLTKDEQNTFV